MDPTSSVPTSHGGILFPLDMFRPTMLASALAEVLIGKVRNILDATIEISRHPVMPLALVRIHGSVVGDDVAEFWRENMDLALVVSQIVPRQCFVYYARSEPNPRQGFLVAQRGQALAADDSNRTDLPPGQADNHWPVSRLCEQMRISVEELGLAFPEGPRIELSLMEPSGNDQALLMALVEAQPGGGEPDEPSAAPPPRSGGGGLTQGFSAPPSAAGPSGPAGGPAGGPGPGPARPAATRPTVSADDDAKRRAADRAAEQAALKQRSTDAASALQFIEDDLGVLVFLPVELSETAVLRPFLIPQVDRNAPESLPGPVRERLQGRALDIAVKVEFLSEVFVDNQPLNRSTFEAKAQAISVDGLPVHALEVLAPRLGLGTLLRSDNHKVFVSRRVGTRLPESFLHQLLA